jgi:hypothetical protein
MNVINPKKESIIIKAKMDFGFAKFTVQPIPYLFGGKILLSSLLK